MKIDDDLFAVTLCKENVVLNRPSYIGQVVLDLSKLRMYELQYVEFKMYREMFNCEIRIIAGDTDSYFLQCKNVNLREQLIPKMIEDGLLDTSNYAEDDPLFSNAICSKIGKIKDENKGNPFYEWVFLRPKCYSLRSDKETMRSKGITLKGSSVNFQTYKNIYESNSTLSIDQTRFVSKQHQMYTTTVKKKALQCTDDKRHWINGNNSVAYGHYSLM